VRLAAVSQICSVLFCNLYALLFVTWCEHVPESAYAGITPATHVYATNSNKPFQSLYSEEIMQYGLSPSPS